MIYSKTGFDYAGRPIPKNKPLGKQHPCGYWFVGIKYPGTKTLMRWQKRGKIVYRMHHGYFPKDSKLIHRNGDKLDDRIANLTWERNKK